jgi:uncharacterized membrane protein
VFGETDENERGGRAKSDSVGLERLIFFSDAVFAIAITLLALDIRLPQGLGDLNDQALLRELLSIWPRYLGYVVSFLVLGNFWISHHRKYRHIRRYDSVLLQLNLLLLMAIAFIPFPTAILSEYGNRTATIFYALSISLAGLLSTVIWLYATHDNRLVDAGMSAAIRRRETRGPLAVIGVFVFSIGVAFINADLAKLSWFVVTVALWLATRIKRTG